MGTDLVELTRRWTGVTVTPYAKSAEPFLCGMTAAMFAGTCTHPIDLAKVRLQLHAVQHAKAVEAGLAQATAPKPNILTVLSSTVREGGALAIYDGVTACWGRQAVYGTARLGLNMSFSEILAERNNCHATYLPFHLKALSGMASGSIAVCLGTPFDVALVRMQSDSMKPPAERRNYTSVIDALLQVKRNEGLAALYTGLAPNILRGMAMNVGGLSCYDQAKLFTMRVFGDTDPKKVSLATQLSAASFAGFAASFLSLPCDLIKSRLQDMKPLPDGTMPYRGIADCASKVLRNEGVFAFWTGMGPYWARLAPQSTIILLTIEAIRPAYRQTFRIEA